MDPKVVVTNWIHDEVKDYLSQHATLVVNETKEPWSRDQIIQACAEADALMAFMPDHVDGEFLDACPSLRMIGCALKGYDNFDIEACRERDVMISFVPDLLTIPTAELAVGLMIALGRNIMPGDAFVRTGNYRGWRPRFYGTGLANSKVGIIGMGAVGRAIARKLAPFGCVMTYDDVRPLTPEDENALSVKKASLQHLAVHSDFVVVVAPLVEGTMHLVDESFISAMKPGALLINVGRGSVVDEAAVVEALESGHLGGYAADVYEMEDWARSDRPLDVPAQLLANAERTVLTPHIGSAVDKVRLDIAMCAARNIVQFLNNEQPDDIVETYSTPTSKAS